MALDYLPIIVCELMALTTPLVSGDKGDKELDLLTK
jgi:hypothetical protein